MAKCSTLVRGLRVVVATVALTLVTAAAGSEARAQGGDVITVQGEAPTDANIPTASDPSASEGAYLALDAAEEPTGGWFATYEVDVPAAGVYRLDAVATPPFGSSYFSLSVNGSPLVQVSKSHPYWGEYPNAWGELHELGVQDVELAAGANEITFTVDERRIWPAPTNFRFFLDEFTLTPTDLALSGVHLGDPSANLGTYRVGEPGVVEFRLNGHTTEAQSVEYRITDYHSEEAASGAATIEAGDTMATIELPDLPPGNYRVTARLPSSPDDKVVGYFAHLPKQRAVTGPASRFGVMSHPELLPTGKLDAFAAGMREMGVGVVRDEIPWPVIEPERGAYDTSLFDRYARAFHDHGVETLAFWGSGEGWQAPDWARSETSGVLPADLRDAYNFTGHLARQTTGVGANALELWNEPEQESFCCSTGDHMAAYTKAASLGIDDAPRGPLTALPAIFSEGEFQDLMLQNDVARYADIWAFHSYPAQFPNAGGLTPFPPQSEIQHGLRRLYGAETQMWGTEAGLFSPTTPGGADLTPAQQVDQARYLVQSTVQDLATGTDRHFWFIGTPCCAGELVPGLSLYFGLLSRDFQPWPAYSAHAAMAAILGEANFAHAVEGLPENVNAYVFNNGRRSITVVWADAPTEAEVPVRGRAADVYDVMGAPQPELPADDGTVPVTATLDPIYLVTGRSAAPGRARGNDGHSRRGQPSKAEHIVLSQRYAADNAAPEKHAEDEPPFGYELDPTTEMSLDVYNFNRRPQTVRLSSHAYGGWSVHPVEQLVVRVPAGGRASVPFTISSSDDVEPAVDYPLVFEGKLGRHDIPPSVARVQLRSAGAPGEPVPLAPVISDVSPADGAIVTGPRVELDAQLADRVSGIDPERVGVEVDGSRVHSDYDVSTGRLSARLHLRPGQHNIWIRAYNNAHAPAQASVDLTVRRRGAR